MKVITQLVQYFWKSETITAEQAEYLMQNGFARLRDVPGFVPPKPHQGPVGADQAVPLLGEIGPQLEPLEVVEHMLTEKRCRGPVQRRIVQDSQIRARFAFSQLRNGIETQFARREAAFGPLVTLARQFGPCQHWKEAVLVLLPVSHNSLSDGLRSALNEGSVTLEGIRNALDLDPYRKWLKETNVRGRAVRGCRLLLQSDSGKLGKYSFLLRCPEIRALYNLLRVSRKLSAAIVSVQLLELIEG